MHELSQINEISPFQAILWCFYPIGFVVLFELVLRTNDDDDDDEGWWCYVTCFIKEPNESFIIYTNYRCIFSN